MEWRQDQKRVSEGLKEAFTTAPVLARFDFERDAVMETDASNYVSAGVLSQYDGQGILYPVAFFSKKYAPDECNHEIYDTVLLTEVRAFE